MGVSYETGTAYSSRAAGFNGVRVTIFIYAMIVEGLAVNQQMGISLSLI